MWKHTNTTMTIRAGGEGVWFADMLFHLAFCKKIPFISYKSLITGINTVLVGKCLCAYVYEIDLKEQIKDKRWGGIVARKKNARSCFDSIPINVRITTKVDQEKDKLQLRNWEEVSKCEGVPRKTARFELRREEAVSGQGEMEEGNSNQRKNDRWWQPESLALSSFNLRNL